MNKIAKILLLFLLISVQVSLVPTLPYPFQTLYPVFIFAIFTTIMYSDLSGLFWTLILGLSMDYFSSQPFGIITFSLFTTMLLMHLLFELMFTNKSFYSLGVLAVIGNILFNALVIALSFVTYFFKIHTIKVHWGMELIQSIIWQTILTVVMLFFVWKIANLLSKRFKIVFL